LNWIEIAGFITGVIGVWLTIKENIWCWLLGIINVILYLILFFDLKLYADAWLQGFYIVTQIYGWYKWSKGTSIKDELMITFCSKKVLFICLIATILMTFLFGFYFSHYTEAALPWWDSSLMAMSLTGTWMAANKKIENWIVWIIANFIYIQIYIIKDTILTAALYFIFFLLAIEGYFEWKASWQKTKTSKIL
jgi:nicotinamide mononucleotide transporter